MSFETGSIIAIVLGVGLLGSIIGNIFQTYDKRETEKKLMLLKCSNKYNALNLLSSKNSNENLNNIIQNNIIREDNKKRKLLFVNNDSKKISKKNDNLNNSVLLLEESSDGKNEIFNLNSVVEFNVIDDIV